MRGRDKRYAIDQCALYNCNTKRRLFKYLQTTTTKYAELKSTPDWYRPLIKEKKNGEPRLVHAPRYDLKRIQRRLCELLMRLDPPDFLMSPVRGRSHVDNAVIHRGAAAYRLIDLEDFYPNCSANKVAEFFSKTLKCSDDVVAVLVRLTTHDGALPQGSPASPILAYFAYKDMWDEITVLAKDAGNKITVYVDDVTISGDQVLGKTVWAIKKVLSKHGHKTKDAKEEARQGTPVKVTGVVLHETKMLVPNALQKKRYELQKELETKPSGYERERLSATLAGYDETERQIQIKS
jgi:hypothetical protein